MCGNPITRKVSGFYKAPAKVGKFGAGRCVKVVNTGKGSREKTRTKPGSSEPNQQVPDILRKESGKTGRKFGIIGIRTSNKTQHSARDD